MGMELAPCPSVAASCSYFMHYSEEQHSELVARRSPELQHSLRLVPNDQALVFSGLVAARDGSLPSLQGLATAAGPQSGEFLFYANSDGAAEGL
jgi:hypothetical protein